MDYRNVKKSKADLDELIRLEEGGREVPLILHQGKVEVGWEGGS